MAQTLKLLLNGPVTAQEVAEHTGIHIVTAQEWMRSLRKEKVVYISGWIPDSLGRDTTAVHSIGKGKDATRHKFTAAQRQARYRARKTQATLAKILNGEPL